MYIIILEHKIFIKEVDQSKLARDINWSRQYINQIFRGKRPVPSDKKKQRILLEGIKKQEKRFIVKIEPSIISKITETIN